MMQCGCDCGTLAPPSAIGPPGVVPFPSFVPLIIPAAAIVAGWDARDLSASPVALWPDASGNGFDLTQAVGASQPTWGAATGPNGQPAVLYDGVNDRLFNAALNLPPPATTPTFYWGIFRSVTWTNLDRFFGAGAGAAGLVLIQTAATPNIRQADNVQSNENTGLTLNVYKRVEVFFNNAITDFIHAGSVTTTGANAGNVDPLVVFSMGSDGPGTLFGNVEFCELWIFNTLPSASQLTALDAYAAARYGAGVLT